MTCCTFHARVNDGPDFTVKVASGLYSVGAAAAAAMHWPSDNAPCIVKIWHPACMPEYGPYLYRVRFDEFVRLVVESVVRVP